MAESNEEEPQRLIHEASRCADALRDGSASREPKWDPLNAVIVDEQCNGFIGLSGVVWQGRLLEVYAHDPMQPTGACSYKHGVLFYTLNSMEKDLLALRTGSLLRERRETAGLTLHDLHRRCGVTVAQLSRIENGLADPRLSTLVRILEATGGTLCDIVVEPISVVGIDDVLDPRSRGRRRIEQAGLEHSDPAERLDRRELAGADSTAERTRLATT